MMLCRILFILILTPLLSSVYAGDKEKIEEYEERVFIKTDKSLYISGEIIWYSARLYNDGTGEISDKNTFVYIEVIDSLNNSVLRQVASIKNGGGSGSIHIPAEILSGNYYLRAYTSLMKNYGAEAFFHKPFTIVNTFKPLYTQNQEGISLKIHAEGGGITAGVENNISLLVSDVYGKGKPFSGYVLSSSGDTLKSFQSSTGNQSFKLFVDEALKYNVIINSGLQTLREPLVVDKSRSISMMVNESGNGFNVFFQKAATSQGRIKLQLLHKKKILKTIETEIAGSGSTIFINKNELPSGITKLQILNSEDNPIASRLLFMAGSSNAVPELKLEKSSFGKRENIEINLENNQPPVKVLVYALKTDISEIENTGIEYYRLIAGEIKGIDEKILIEAWRKGEINNILIHAEKRKINSDTESFPEEKETQVVHAVVKDKSGNPAKDVQVFLSRRSTAVDLYGDVSDDNGNIYFHIKPDLKNKELIFQTVEDYSIDIIPPFSNSFVDSKLPPFKLEPEWEKYIREASINLQVEMSYNASRWNTYEELPADSSAFYKTPDYSYYLDDYRRFPSIDETITEYIFLGRVRKSDGKRGIMIYDLEKDEMLRAPFILLDGVPVFDYEKILDYDPYKIKRIDLINSRYFYGPFLFSGILSFRTYTGTMDGFELSSNARRVAYEQPQRPRLFNNIQYKEGTQTETIPDNRNLLLWEDIENYDGKDPIRFSTSDLAGNYKLVAEVIYPDGTVSTVTKEIEVK